MWTYTRVYQAFMHVIDKDLRDVPCSVNFSVIAIATVSPRVLTRITITSLETGRVLRWKTILKGETLLALQHDIKTNITRKLTQFPEFHTNIRE